MGSLIQKVYFIHSNLINTSKTSCLSDSPFKQSIRINHHSHTLNSRTNRISLQMAAGDSTTSSVNVEQNPGQFSIFRQFFPTPISNLLQIHLLLGLNSDLMISSTSPDFILWTHLLHILLN